MTGKLSLYDRYIEEKMKPTPGQIFIEELAKVTHRTPGTVRMWVMGRQYPDPLAMEAISKYLDTDIEVLFPNCPRTVNEPMP